jgi:capsid protein
MIAAANGHRRKFRNVNTAIEQMGAKYDGAMADYQATKKGRFNKRRKNLPIQGGSADYHIRNEWEFYNLIEDCYDLERNDAVVGQLLDRRTANVVQDGFRLEPNTGDKALDNDIKERWNEWANDPDQCDVAGEASFHDFEYAADWTHILAGDCGISLTETGHLQFFEPYLIRNRRGQTNEFGNDTFLGVDMDEDRRHVRYWIAQDNVDPYDTTFQDFAPVETRDDRGRRQFFHIYNQKRMTLTRGVSAFAPVFELTGMLEDVNFAKLVQQQIVSCIAFLIEESDATGGKPLPSTTNTGNNRTESFSVNGDRTYDEVAPGMEVRPGAGRKVSGFSPQVPNPEYFQQYRLILQLICGNLDLPLAIGMLDGSETNFHGFIGAINEAKKLWRKSQKRLDKRFHRGVYLGKLQHFTVEDRAIRDAAKRLPYFQRHTWHYPVWQSVKPLDDTNDRLMRLRNAIVSPSRMHAELNVDYEQHVTETVRDNSLAVRVAKREAIKINGDPLLQDGQPVHWQQLYPMPMPDGIQATAEIVKEPEAVDDQTENETNLVEI